MRLNDLDHANYESMAGFEPAQLTLSLGSTVLSWSLQLTRLLPTLLGGSGTWSGKIALDTFEYPTLDCLVPFGP